MKYFDDWEKRGIDELRLDFRIKDTDVVDEQIIYAAYSYENYSGNAIVVFSKDTYLFEVNASHCSCYGLEDQWQPERTTWEAIAFRHDSVYGLSDLAVTALREIIKEYSGKE